MFKKIILIITILSIGFMGCTSNVQDENLSSSNLDNLQENDSENNVLEDDTLVQEILNEIKFNQNLTDYEQKWLNYLQEKYPHTKIYHINTKLVRCIGCYDLSYKKDREIVIIQVRDSQKTAEKIVVNDLATEIKNENVCKLFQGSWNECPKLCNTDEKACETECGLPVCEFDYNKISYNKLGEECGGLDKGDCEYNLNCYYDNNDDKYGICR